MTRLPRTPGSAPRGCFHTALALLALLAAGAAPAAAQACVGLPLADGELWLSGVVRGGDPVRYGGQLDANISGPLTISLGYLRSGDDADDYTLSTRAAYELPYMEPSLCPVVGARYTRIPVQGADARSRLAIPVGFGVGKTLPLAPAASLTVFAIPELSFVRTESLDADGARVNRNTRELGAELGALLGVGPLYLGITTQVGEAFTDSGEILFRVGFGL